MYHLIRRILFLFDAEKVHYFSMNSLRLILSVPFFKKIVQRHCSFPSTPVRLLNLEFKNIVGLGAGFDKNAIYLTELESVGFGFVEIGTVTPLPQEGNEKPRLFRLPKDKALINRMGFNNEGAATISSRLANWRKKNPTSRLIIGGNIGKNKITPNEDAWKDYQICFEALYNHVDYFVVNVSSPNTPGLRALQEKDSLRKIFKALQEKNHSHKAILLKIAPDLSLEQIDDIIKLSEEINLDGIIISNTTINRQGLQSNENTITQIGAGGISGLPLQKRSSELIQYVFQKTNGKLFIMGSGGIFSGADAKEKIHAGASLIQVWTGFVYEGPTIVKKILQQLN